MQPHSAASSMPLAIFEHTDLDERRIWSVKEYVSLCGNVFEISNIFIAPLKAG